MIELFMVHLFRDRYDIILVNVYIFFKFYAIACSLPIGRFCIFGPNRNVKLLCAHFCIILADYPDLHIPPPLIVRVH